MNKAQALLEKLRQQKEESAALQEYWASSFPEFPVPDFRQMKIWLDSYDFDTVVYGLDVVLKQHSKRSQSVAEQTEGATLMTSLDIIKFASKCMVNQKKKAEEGE